MMQHILQIAQTYKLRTTQLMKLMAYFIHCNVTDCHCMFVWDHKQLVFKLYQLIWFKMWLYGISVGHTKSLNTDNILIISSLEQATYSCVPVTKQYNLISTKRL